MPTDVTHSETNRQPRMVGILTNERWSYCRDILAGIAEYAYHEANWTVQIGANALEDLKRMRAIKVDGLIIHDNDKRLLPAIRRMKTPVVNTSAARDPSSAPSVVSDDLAVGKMAAEHLLERGFRRFLLVGPRTVHYFKQRVAGFEQRARADAEHCQVLSDPLAYRLQDSSVAVRKQLAVFRTHVDAIAKPMAIFGADDVTAFRVLDALRQLDVKVPEDVAVLGVNDDELRCGLSTPPLSSVRLPGEQVGVEAARLLQAMMSGGKPPIAPTMLAPLSVRVRQSTDLHVIEDEAIRSALQLIRAYALDEAFEIQTVLDATPVARRTLEKRFKAAVGRTLMEHVVHVRIQRARELLSDTERNMSEIAVRCGFRNSHRFAEAFRRLEGTTPTAYRRRQRRR